MNLMSHNAVTTPGTLRLLLARTTPGPQRSRAESRRLLLARDYSWPVTPDSQSREPRMESSLLPFRSLGIFHSIHDASADSAV